MKALGIYAQFLTSYTTKGWRRELYIFCPSCTSCVSKNMFIQIFQAPYRKGQQK